MRADERAAAAHMRDYFDSREDVLHVINTLAPRECCDGMCNQGRDCPVRDACRLPEPDPFPWTISELVLAVFAVAVTVAGVLGVIWRLA